MSGLVAWLAVPSSLSPSLFQGSAEPRTCAEMPAQTPDRTASTMIALSSIYKLDQTLRNGPSSTICQSGYGQSRWAHRSWTGLWCRPWSNTEGSRDARLYYLSEPDTVKSQPAHRTVHVSDIVSHQTRPKAYLTP